MKISNFVNVRMKEMSIRWDGGGVMSSHCELHILNVIFRLTAVSEIDV